MTEKQSNQSVECFTDEMCSFPNCEFCHKLNEIGKVIFPTYVKCGESFDKFGELFNHQTTIRR